MAVFVAKFKSFVIAFKIPSKTLRPALIGQPKKALTSKNDLNGSVALLSFAIYTDALGV